ncbi:hypothetical protein N8591_01240 [bacterium]|nr:hypothetical protein [bacterium]
MKNRHSKYLQSVAICTASVLLTLAHVCIAQTESAGSSEIDVVALQKKLKEAGKVSSSIRKRRAYKNVVRDGEALVEKSIVAAKRFSVLAIIFQCQTKLLALENSDRNRQLLFATSGRLVEAPDKFADLRIEADLLLLERDLSAKKADVKERAKALESLIARYRDTPGEKKCLMMAALIVAKLNAADLEKSISRTLGERFAGDLDVIKWRQGRRDYSYFPVVFSGSFTRADGTSLTFPIDNIFGRKRRLTLNPTLVSSKNCKSAFPIISRSSASTWMICLILARKS